MLSKKIETALNEQMSKEAYASNSYLAMASWCDQEGLRGCAAFMYDQSAEEREHMMKLVRYVTDSGGHARISAVKEPVNDYKSIEDVFKLALEHEIEVTQSINKLVEVSLSVKDYTSFNFLQWFVSEQHEEERLFTSILNLIKITGTDDKGVFFIDREISQLRDEEKKS